MNENNIRYPRFSWLIPVPFVLLLMGVAYWAGFIQDDAGNTVRTIAVLIGVVGGFLTFYFIRQFLIHPTILRMNAAGFEYSPSGFSTGFISWSAVEKVEELEVRATNGSNTGQYEAALGIWLREPDRYFDQWNAALRRLMKLNQKMYGATILVQPSSLGKRYKKVHEAFLKQASGER